MKVRYAQYKCNDCGATDTDKVFNHERPATVINCFKFHGGTTIVPGMIALQQQEIRETRSRGISECPGCGARKEIFVNGRATCAYCKSDK